jgi:uncharacterized secreted protein with C-terminal beta-propeller domain
MAQKQRRSQATGVVSLMVIGALAMTLALTGRPGGSAGPAGPATRAHEGELAAVRSFDACDDLLAEIHEVALADTSGEMFTHADGSVAMASRTGDVTQGFEESARDTSEWGGTNIQEIGVDEPDLWKTDGDHLLAIAAGRLQAIDLTGQTPEIVGDLTLPSGGGQLLIDGDVALVIEDGTYRAMTRGAGIAGPSTALTVVDVADPAAMAVVGQATLDGYLLSARLVDGMARVVTSTGGSPIMHGGPVSSGASIEMSVRSTSIDDWMPRFEVVDPSGTVTDDGPLVGCGQVYVAEKPVDATMVNVVSLDLRAGEIRPVDGASVIGAGSTVYASPTALYVAGQTWDNGTGTSSTELHKFATPSRQPASYRASTRVEGNLLNQFSMSEHNGDLRIAVTIDGFPEMSESSVIVLREDGAGLREIGRVDGLGRGERIYSVRFMGAIGYVVTFRETDPLYTLDLADPAAPRMVGELKIPGFSSYLHPVGDGLLLGIGQDATDQGMITGFQVSLFDVGNLASPQQIQKLVLPAGSSVAEYDHHAFTWSAADRLAMMPVTSYEQGSFEATLAVFSVERSGITERAQISHPSTSGPDGDGYIGVAGIQRSMVVDDLVFSLSEAGVKASSMGSFSDVAWLPFR